MTTQTRFRSLIVPAALLLSVSVTRSARADEETKRHVLYDEVDKVWICVGTPVDCNTTGS